MCGPGLVLGSRTIEITAAIVAAWAGAFGTLASSLARARSRSPAAWFGYGVALGPIAALILIAAPPGVCAICRARVRGWSSQCVSCGGDVRGRGEPDAEPEPIRAEPVTVASEPVGVMAGRLQTPAVADPAGTTISTVLAPTRLLVSTRETPATNGHAAVNGTTTTNGKAQLAPTSKTAAAKATPKKPKVGASKASAQRTKPTASTRRRKAVAPPPPDEVHVLVSATFVGGNVPLIPGARYAIGVHEAAMHVLGPLDVAPGQVVVSRLLEDLDVTALSDRIVISAPSSTLGSLGLVFTGINGMSPEGLEQALSAQAAPVGAPATS
jgi:hypothetical protein